MRKALLILSIMVAASLFSTMAFASVNDDQVTSQKIKEADGTSGQNTNSGSGVKTGHIQDGAVTTSKIADSAVTDSKISGTISQSKITGLEAALAGKSDVTHNHDVLYQQKYGKVAVVAQTGGDYASPLVAMNNLAAWCGTPSATNPCLLKIMPGVYDIGGATLMMQQYVDLDGAGENVTHIKGNARNYNPVLWGSANAELRNLTIENYGGNDVAIAILVHAGSVGDSTKITHVTAIASGGINDAIGIYIYDASPELTDVTIKVTGGRGLLNSNVSSPKITNINVTSDGWGIMNEAYPGAPATPVIIGGTINSIIASASSPKIAFSRITGLISGTGFTCFQVYDAAFMPLTCP